MATISRDQAVQKLTQELGALRPDDLAEVFNELFPDQPTTEEEAQRDPSRLHRQISRHFGHGLQAEEVVDLWNVVFPRDFNVYFDEETDTIHFNDGSGSLQYSD